MADRGADCPETFPHLGPGVSTKHTYGARGHSNGCLKSPVRISGENEPSTQWVDARRRRPAAEERSPPPLAACSNLRREPSSSMHVH